MEQDVEQVGPVLVALVVVQVELDEAQVAQGLDEPDVALDAPDAEQVEPELDVPGEVPDVVLDALDEAQDEVLGSLAMDEVSDALALEQDALESPDEVPEQECFHDEMEYGVGEMELQLQEHVLG